MKHTIGDGSFWCWRYGVTNAPLFKCVFESQSECDSKIDYYNAHGFDMSGYACAENTFTDGVTESYVGFVVTSEMATNNPGMVAGTYYLRGGDNGASFVENAKTLYDAFGGVGCRLDGNSGGNPYNTTPSYDFECEVPGVLFAGANSEGEVATGVTIGCRADEYGRSYCFFES